MSTLVGVCCKMRCPVKIYKEWKWELKIFDREMVSLELAVKCTMSV